MPSNADILVAMKAGFAHLHKGSFLTVRLAYIALGIAIVLSAGEGLLEGYQRIFIYLGGIALILYGSYSTSEKTR